MHPLTLTGEAQTLIQYGYWVMFIGMLIEGPIVTAAGAFAAAIGLMDVRIVLLLSILGNLIPDVIYYCVGYWGRKQLIDKYGHYFHITNELVVKIEDLTKKHAWKALSLIKLTSVLATPGLIIVGSMRMPIKKYTWICLAITAPSSLFFLIIGYYFGSLYDKIASYLHYGGYAIIGILGLLVVTFILWKKFTKKFVDRIEKE